MSFDIVVARKRLKRKRAITKAIKNVVLYLMVVGLMTLFISFMINTWVEELDNHGQYNNQYIKELRR